MTSSNRTRIGFVGTGIMGGHMARRLARAGFSVTAWNRTADKAEALVADGLKIAGAAAEAAANADVVICMLSSGPVCDEVLLGDGGVLAAMREGSTLVVMSSIPVETARSQAAEASALNVRYVDAPVSGGENGAREGTLAIMAGGVADDVAALADVFAPMGRVTHVGPVGAGATRQTGQPTHRRVEYLCRGRGAGACRKRWCRPRAGAGSAARWICRTRPCFASTASAWSKEISFPAGLQNTRSRTPAQRWSSPVPSD